jgi:hypothetical protein
MKATRLNSFKVRLVNFYTIYSGIFRTDLVHNPFTLQMGFLKCKCVL